MLGLNLKMTKNSNKPTALVLPDMYTYMRLDLGVGLNSGNVASLGDQTGNNHGLSQATSSKMPLYTASSAAFNNRPIMTLDGIDDVLKGTSFAYGAFTFFMTARLLGTDGYFYTRQGYNDYFFVNGSPEIYVKRGVTICSKSSPLRATATPKFYVLRYDGTAAGLRVFVNNSETTLSPGVTADPGTGSITSNFIVGSDDATYFSNLEVAEIGLATRALSDTEIGALWSDSRALFNLS